MPGFFSSLITVVDTSPKVEMPLAVERNDPVEKELVSAFVKISKGGRSDLRTAESIVDNTKLLVDNYVEMGIVDMRIICDEVATVSAQMAELKETLEKIIAEQLKFSQKYEALVNDKARSVQVDDENERFAYKTMIIVGPLVVGMLSILFGVAYINLQV